MEWCAYLDDCVNCPYYKKDCNCATIALDIIYRQKAENEELRSDKIIAERHEKDARDLFVDCTRQLEEAKVEIERMENQNTLLLKKKCKDINTARKIIKSEAIKDFAERLKRTSIGLEIGDDKKFKMTVVSTVAIDNLVKEMTEEKNGQA